MNTTLKKSNSINPRLFGKFEVILACSVIISAIFISIFIPKFIKPQINPLPNSSSLNNWRQYDAHEDGYISWDQEWNFQFQYPPDFILTRADGPGREFFGCCSVDLSGPDIAEISINILNINGTPQELADTFIQSTLKQERNEEGVITSPLSCLDLSSCDANTFSSQKVTLSNQIPATIVSGPFYKGNAFDIYFMQPNKSTSISISFIYREPRKGKQIKNQILSTFKFTD